MEAPALRPTKIPLRARLLQTGKGIIVFIVGGGSGAKVVDGLSNGNVQRAARQELRVERLHKDKNIKKFIHNSLCDEQSPDAILQGLEVTDAIPNATETATLTVESYHTDNVKIPLIGRKFGQKIWRYDLKTTNTPTSKNEKIKNATSLAIPLEKDHSSNNSGVSSSLSGDIRLEDLRNIIIGNNEFLNQNSENIIGLEDLGNIVIGDNEFLNQNSDTRQEFLMKNSEQFGVENETNTLPETNIRVERELHTSIGIPTKTFVSGTFEKQLSGPTRGVIVVFQIIIVYVFFVPLLESLQKFVKLTILPKIPFLRQFSEIDKNILEDKKKEGLCYEKNDFDFNNQKFHNDTISLLYLLDKKKISRKEAFVVLQKKYGLSEKACELLLINKEGVLEHEDKILSKLLDFC